MKRSRMVALVLVLALVTAKVGVTRPPDDMQLQGTWNIVSVERSGVPDPSPVGYTLSFQGDVLKFQSPWIELDGSVTAPTTSAIFHEYTLQPIDPAKLQAMVHF